MFSSRRPKPNISSSEQRYPQPGDRVLITQKVHYESGELTEGIVKDVLTKKRFHPRGHKVRLTSGLIGRVQKFLSKTPPPEKELTPQTDSDPLALV